MYRNRQLTLDGVFGYNQLLVNGVDVAPNINANTSDISYIFNDGLMGTSQSTLNNAKITEAMSALTQANAQNIQQIQTALNETIVKQKSDVININTSINTQTTALNNYKTTTNDKLTQLTTQVTTLANSPSLNSNQLTTLQNNINTATTAITNLTTKETNDINNLQTQVTKNTNDITNNTTAISNLATKDTTNNLQTQVTKNTSDITNNTTAISNLATKETSDINNLQSQVANNTTDIALLKTQSNTNFVNAITTSLNNLTTKQATDITNVSAQIDSIKTNVANNTTSINGLSTSNITNITNIKKNSDDIASLTTKVNALPTSSTSGITLFSTDKSTTYNNQLSTPNTIGYQIYQNLYSALIYPVTLKQLSNGYIQVASINPLSPLGSIWYMQIKLTCNGIIKTSAGLNPCSFIVFDSGSNGLTINRLYEDYKYINFSTTSYVYLQFMYYVQNPGNIIINGASIIGVSGESYKVANVEFTATRIA